CQGFHGGSPIGTVMATVPDRNLSIAPHNIPLRLSDIPLSNSNRAPSVDVKQKSLDTKVKKAFSAPSAKLAVYEASATGMPVLPLSPDIARLSDLSIDSGPPASLTSDPDLSSTDSESTTEECLTESDLDDAHTTTSYIPSSDHEMPPLSLSCYSSWLYILRQSAAVRAQTERSVNVSSLNAPPPSIPDSNPVYLGCDPDPREFCPPMTWHPPLAIDRVHYDTYDPNAEPDNDSILDLGERIPSTWTPEDSSVKPPKTTQKPDQSTASSPAVALAYTTFGEPKIPFTPPPASSLSTDSSPGLFDYATVQTAQVSHFVLYNTILSIIHRGTVRELFFLAMSTPCSQYLGHARCLRGLTDEQRRQVIGPFTSVERSKFNARFHPTRLEHTIALENYSRLYEICVPDTSADFPPLPEQPPAFKYIEERTRREAQSSYKEPLPHGSFGMRGNGSFPSADQDARSESSDDLQTLENRGQLPHAFEPPQADDQPALPETNPVIVTQLRGPYLAPLEGPEPETFDEFLECLDRDLRHGPLQFDSSDRPKDSSPTTKDPIDLWLKTPQVLSAMEPVHLEAISLRSTDSATPPRYPQPESHHPRSDFYNSTDDKRSKEVLKRQQAQHSLFPTGMTQTVFDSNRRNFQVPADQSACVEQRACLVLPPTVVPVFYESHLRDSRKTKKAVNHVQEVANTHVINFVHPVKPEYDSVRYDLAPDAYRLLFVRENIRWEHDADDDNPRRFRFNEEVKTLSELIRIDPETQVPYFPAGAFNQILAQYFYPRSLGTGYRRLLNLRAENGEHDELTALYPDILKRFRCFSNHRAYKFRSVADYLFHNDDSRFATTDVQAEITRPQLFILRYSFLEPTLFGSRAKRPWVLLLPDCDLHSWGPLEGFAILCAKDELIKKSMVAAESDAVPGLAGVPHLLAQRPGIPDAFILSISIGSTRPDTRPAEVPSISPRWDLRHGGRFLVALYCGLVKRVSLSRAAKLGITSAAYDLVMADRSDVNKYYEVRESESGELVRTRRPGVFPPSLSGTYRPVYSNDPESDAEPKLLFYEHIVFEGLGFSHKVINIGDNWITTVSGATYNASRGGPRLLLVRREPIETELFSAFLSLPAFILDNWQRIHERCRRNNPGSPELQRAFSLSDVTFSAVFNSLCSFMFSAINYII
ncbi:unnamed protein product, partial [Oikopleura dioica]